MARGESTSEGGRQISAGLIGTGVIGVLLIIFIVQNTADTPVSLLVWDFTAPLWLVLLGTAIVALVLSELVGLVRRRR